MPEISPLTPEQRDRFDRMGRDLELIFSGPAGLWEDGDLNTAGRTRRSDLAVATDLTAIDQFLVNRVMTRRGELAPLGHPNYGSRHHELIGEPNTETTRRRIKVRILEALRDEPRIEEILECKVYAPHQPPRDLVRIELQLRLIPGLTENPVRNLIVPFSLET